VPPHEPVYQYQFAPGPRFPPEKLNVTGEPEHMTEGFALAEVAETELEFTSIVTLAHKVIEQVLAALT
jgi:hypothetical protein